MEETEEGGAGAPQEAAGGAQRPENGSLPPGRRAGHPADPALHRRGLVRSRSCLRGSERGVIDF